MMQGDRRKIYTKFRFCAKPQNSRPDRSPLRNGCYDVTGNWAEVRGGGGGGAGAENAPGVQKKRRTALYGGQKSGKILQFL